MENKSTGIDPETQHKIIALIKALMPDVKIWLYGSRARGDFSEHSDIDIALEAPTTLDFFKLAELQDVLRATDISDKIDLVDINSVDDSMFKKSVLKDRILWKN